MQAAQLSFKERKRIGVLAARKVPREEWMIGQEERWTKEDLWGS